MTKAEEILSLFLNYEYVDGEYNSSLAAKLEKFEIDYLKIEIEKILNSK